MNIKLLLGIITGLVVGAAGTAGVVATIAPEDVDARFGGVRSFLTNHDDDLGKKGRGMRGQGYGLGYSGGGAMRQELTGENCLGDECLAINDLEYPVGDLSSRAKEALNAAIQDEYHAYATYGAVLETFGSVRPFSMIIRAEEQHINALKAVYDRYGVEVPEEESIGIDVTGTLAEMCQVGVDAEIANAALYRNELLPAVTEYEDIIFVFTNLMNASQEKHLPAFERCAG